MKMKMESFHSLTIKELNQLLQKTQKELIEAKLKLTIGKLKNTSTISFKRRQIAKIKTIIREKQFL